MTTLADIARRTTICLDPHIDTTVDLEPQTGLTAQGDLLIIPLAITAPTGGSPVPASGVPVIEGTHDHVLVADPGTARWVAGAGPSELSIGVVVATKPVWLLHAEHGGHCLAAGVWEMRGQREDSREGQRRVVD